MRLGGRLQCAAVCLLIGAYAGLSHCCNTAGSPAWGAVLAWSPLAVLALVFAWRSLPAPGAAFVSVTLVVLLIGSWPFLRRSFPLFSLVEETGLYVLLGISFGRSLRRGRIALCTRLADKVHGPLSPREVRYTRQVTAAWTAFFCAIAATSIGLFLGAPQ